MHFADIWNTSEADYQILVSKLVLSDLSYFFSNIASTF